MAHELIFKGIFHWGDLKFDGSIIDVSWRASLIVYGANMWTLKAPDVCTLATFHNCCICTILGVTRCSQWKEHSHHY